MTPGGTADAPPIVVDHDDRWIQLELTGDLPAWARQTAADIKARARAAGQARTVNEQRVAALLTGAGQLARRPGDAAMALLLYPTPADGMVALVRFCRVDLAGREGEEAWSGLVCWLTPAGDAGPPEITELATGAGPCRRIRRRFTAGAGGEGPAGEHLGYAWTVPGYGIGMVAVTSFTDLAAADRWRPAVDELASAVALGPATEHAPGEAGPAHVSDELAGP